MGLLVGLDRLGGFVQGLAFGVPLPFNLRDVPRSETLANPAMA